MVSRGFKTVVDLRFEDRDNQWTRPVGGGAGVGKLGDESLEVIHIPVTDMEPPSFEDVERFIEVADDESKRPMFVHCKAGIGRTGSMVSCWRISRGMKVDDALALESLNCDFGSLAQEAFVREFADRLARKRLGSWDDDDEERATLRKLEQEAHAAEEAAAEATKPAGTAKAHEPSSAVYKVAGATEPESTRGAKSTTAPDPSPSWTDAAKRAAALDLETAPAYEGAGVQRGRRVGVCFERAVPVDAERAGGHGQRRFHRGGVRGGRALVSRPGAGHVRDPHGRFHVHARGGGGAHAQDLAPLHAAAGARVARPPEAHLHRQEARVGAPAQPHRGGARVHVHGVRGDRGGVRYGRDASRALENPAEPKEVGLSADAMAKSETKSKTKKPRKNLADPAETASAADVRDAVLAKVGTLRVDESDGRIPREDWGTVDLVVCLGGDGVILHASKLFQGPVPPLMGFHFGSMGFLTNHPPEQLAQSLLQSVGRGPKQVSRRHQGRHTPSRCACVWSARLVKANDSVAQRRRRRALARVRGPERSARRPRPERRFCQQDRGVRPRCSSSRRSRRTA